MRPSKRQALWASALGATLAATLWSATQDDEADAPAAAQALVRARPSPAAPSTATPGATASAAPTPPTWNPAPLQRQPWPSAKADALLAWAPPPPPPEAPPPPPPSPPPAPPPVAPPFPYQAIGRMEEGGQTVLFVANAQRSAALRVGDVLDGSWRVEHIGPQGAQLRWLPAGLPVNIALRPL
ncbi:hypothetical protein ACG0Z6_11685 [Roseateles sp. BYS180W]|uniref:Uncharacterized protein n=1 Tax=Roseateles rivi TaxID=3299028 RepID=A0ABW7FX38_9BURK